MYSLTAVDLGCEQLLTTLPVTFPTSRFHLFFYEDAKDSIVSGKGHTNTFFDSETWTVHPSPLRFSGLQFLFDTNHHFTNYVYFACLVTATH
jgi:hypothetical protein